MKKISKRPLPKEELTTLNQAIGYLLRQHRLQNKHSLATAAELLCMSPYIATQLELGSLPYHKERLAAIAAYMDISSDYLTLKAQELLQEVRKQ